MPPHTQQGVLPHTSKTPLPPQLSSAPSGWACAQPAPSRRLSVYGVSLLPPPPASSTTASPVTASLTAVAAVSASREYVAVVDSLRSATQRRRPPAGAGAGVALLEKRATAEVVAEEVGEVVAEEVAERGGGVRRR